jgi:hypothetical protein
MFSMRNTFLTIAKNKLFIPTNTNSAFLPLFFLDLLRGVFLAKPLVFNPVRSDVSVLSVRIDYLEDIRYVIMVLFLGLTTPSVNAQTWTLYMRNDGVNCRTFKVDKAQNIYIITNDNRILKYDREGKFQDAFSYNAYGTIASLDVRNPAQPIVYYTDVQAVVVLNAQMDAVKTHFLGKLGLLYGEMIAMGDDGFLYVYESRPQQVVKMGFEGTDLKRVAATKPLNFSGFTPKHLQVNSGILYFNVPEKGIMTFDQKGELLKIYGLTQVAHFTIEKGRFIFSKDNFLQEFDLNTAVSRPLSMPREVVGKVLTFMENGRLYAQRGYSVDVYVQ